MAMEVAVMTELATDVMEATAPRRPMTAPFLRQLANNRHRELLAMEASTVRRRQSFRPASRYGDQMICWS
jgi:hypothetical protein